MRAVKLIGLAFGILAAAVLVLGQTPDISAFSGPMGLTLTPSPTPPTGPTDTPVPPPFTETSTPVPPTATPTPLPPTETPTTLPPTKTPTSLPPTETPTTLPPTETPTSLPPTETPTTLPPTETPITPSPTEASATPSPSATPTTPPPTATATAAPTRTPLPTTKPHPSALPQPHLAIVKTVEPSEVLPGGQVVFTLRVCNDGDSTANDIVVSDTLPSELEIVRASASQGHVMVEGNSVQASLGSLAPGACAEIVIEARVRAEVPPRTQIVNVAIVNGQTSNEVPVAVVLPLPVTGGQAPLVRITALGGLLLTMLLGSGWAWLRQRERHYP